MFSPGSNIIPSTLASLDAHIFVVTTHYTNPLNSKLCSWEVGFHVTLVVDLVNGHTKKQMSILKCEMQWVLEFIGVQCLCGCSCIFFVLFSLLLLFSCKEVVFSLEHTKIDGNEMEWPHIYPNPYGNGILCILLYALHIPQFFNDIDLLYICLILVAM